MIVLMSCRLCETIFFNDNDAIDFYFKRFKEPPNCGFVNRVFQDVFYVIGL